MENTEHLANHPNRLMKWPLLCGLLSLVMAYAALATVPLYDNESVLNYTIPPDNFPLIDASNFLNNSSLTINFETLTANTELFETLNTLNFTNTKTGVLSANNGFRFDTQTTNVIPRQMAGSFYNKGQIYSASLNDTNVAFLFDLGQTIVWATNIVNPGLIDVGQNGLIQLTGQNVDLTRSVITMEGAVGINQDFFSLFGTTGISGMGAAVGIDTNRDWDPSIKLTTNSASASAPIFLTLPNSTPYFDIKNPATNDTIIRAVFLLNSNPTVTNNVYIDPVANTGQLGFGAGAAHVEFIGPYYNPATGMEATNYLYLTDDYLGGAQTNVPIINGIPDNFTFTSSTTQIPLGPATPPNFPTNIFNPGVVTNTYSYANVQFAATTVPTNSPSQNVSNYLAILPGRIQITANQELNLSLAQISGPNYLSIIAPNQFDGSAGAQISSPYADLNLGVTNGFLTISNLLQPALPSWNGSVQVWSATWLFVDPNGVTNDFRVLLVNSQLAATTPSQVQNLKLHGSNSITISDALTVIGTFSADAQNLTLTTNGPGSASFDGELNVQPLSASWATSTPNLRNLTNNGAIRLQNLAVFGTTPPANYQSFVNSGLISDSGSRIWANNFASGGIFADGTGQFTLQSLTTTLTNGSISAGGDISISTGSLLASNVLLSAGASLTFAPTNTFSDTGVTNGNIWSASDGVNLLIKPPVGDLLGTTITNIAPDHHDVDDIWAGNDLGYSTAGYSNNVAVGKFILDAAVTNASDKAFTGFSFSGVGASNAMYVDYLELRDYATNRSNGNVVTALSFPDPSMVIYYAQAVANGVSVAEKINGSNNGHLRWISAYAGFNSSTNIVYTNIFNGMTNITTNAFNAALAQSTTYDSDGDSIVNANDPTPFFVGGEMNFRLTLTNLPPLTALISWQTIPDATNYLYYKTNLVVGSWLPLTNFISPTTYPAPLTTVTVSDPVNLTVPKFYQVRVMPSTAPPYGPPEP